MTANECRTKSAEASERAAGLFDPSLRKHFEIIARDWADLATRAARQEAWESGVRARTIPEDGSE
jgi:hypothetical protein